MFHIVFNADENYIPYCAVLITSIIQATKTENPPPPAESQPKGFCFHILSDSLLDSTLKKLSKLEQELSHTFPCKIFTYFLSDAEFKECPQWSNHTNHLAYFRIKLASVLPYEVKRCLYLDIDMLVLKDLRELFALPLGDNIAGVVLDCSNPYKEKRLKAKDSTQEDFIFPFRKEYFNSGFMLINLTKWRELQIEYKCMKFLQTYIPPSSRPRYFKCSYRQ